MISVSSALQIAGRAGRFGTQWEHGYVTTFKPDDLGTLQELLRQPPEPLLQAGLHPTADQIELYAYHLPNSTLSNLMVRSNSPVCEITMILGCCYFGAQLLIHQDLVFSFFFIMKHR